MPRASIFFEMWAYMIKEQPNLSEDPKTERTIKTCAYSLFGVTLPRGERDLEQRVVHSFLYFRHTSRRNCV